MVTDTTIQRQIINTIGNLPPVFSAVRHNNTPLGIKNVLVAISGEASRHTVGPEPTLGPDKLSFSLVVFGRTGKVLLKFSLKSRTLAKYSLMCRHTLSNNNAY